MTWYLARVRWCLANRWKTLGVATVAIGGMLALFPLLPTGFSPAGDNGFTRLTVELAPGLVDRGHARGGGDGAPARLRRCPRSRSVYTAIGTQGGGNRIGGGGGSAGSVRRASLMIQIDNKDGTRGAQQAFERKATEMLRDIPGARLQFEGSGGDRLQVTLAGDAPERARRARRRTSSASCARCRARHDHEQRGAAAARDRDPAAVRPRGGARRHDRDAEPRHEHRDERRRRHGPREVQSRQSPDPDPRALERPRRAASSSA